MAIKLTTFDQMSYTADQLKIYTDNSIPGEATTSASGLMSANDKIKLNNIESGAQVNVIEKIALDGVSNPLTPKSKIVTIPLVTDTVNGLMAAEQANLLSALDEYIEELESRLTAIESMVINQTVSAPLVDSDGSLIVDSDGAALVFEVSTNLQTAFETLETRIKALEDAHISSNSFEFLIV